MTVPPDISLRKLICFIMNTKEPIPLQLEHVPNLAVFYIDPKDIKDFFLEMSG